MGSINADLIRACERARKAGETVEQDRLVRIIDQTQALCRHPLPLHREQMLTKDSATGRYRKGTILRWCLRCSKILSGGDADMIGVVAVEDIA